LDHKVYITDWKNARNVPLSEGEFHLDDYVHYIEEFLTHIQSIYGNCHVISVCQPTVPVLAAVSLMASRGMTTPITMTMMGGPIDASKSPTAVNNLALNKSHSWFENNVIFRVPVNFPGAGRRVYPGFLQHTGFVAMNPERHLKSHYDFFKDLIKGDNSSADNHRKFYDEYNAVLDMDADYYLETINVVFQEMKLVKGTWDVISDEGVKERVRPQDITQTALFTVEGELDDISGSGQTKAAQALCSGIPAKNHQHLEVKGAGHYGIFSGRRWREVVYPAVKAFIHKFDKDQAQLIPVKTSRKTPSSAVTKATTPTPKPKAKPLVRKASSTMTKAQSKSASAPLKAAAKTPRAKKT
jgi:poly(3-hydroxybutyrate) depolymerase